MSDDQTTRTHDSLASLVSITVSASWGFDGVYCTLPRKRSIYVSALLLLRGLPLFERPAFAVVFVMGFQKVYEISFRFAFRFN